MQNKFGLSLSFFIFLFIAACNKPDPKPIIEPDTRYKAEHAEQVKKTIRDYLGNGYRGYEYYANPESIAAPLFDLSDHKNVDIISAESFKDRFSSGETKSEFFDSFSANVSVSGTHEGFSGEVSSNFSNEVLRNRAHSFATSHMSQKYYRISVLDSASLTEQAKTDLEDLDPQALFDKYGTHYLKSIFIGGRVSFSTFIDRSRFKDLTKFQASVNASYLDVVKGSGSAESKSNSDVQMISQNREIDVIGGDPAEANNVESGSGDPAASYNTWSRTVPNFMSIADFADGGMVPIYELIQNPERKKLVLTAWEKHMSDKTADVLKEADPNPVKLSDGMFLQYSDGRYFGVAPGGNRFYYPKMSKTGLKLLLGLNNQTLKHNNNVNIITSEKFKNTINPWSTRVYLGAYLNHWLYYWTEDAAHTNWIFEKVVPSSDNIIRYGDEVRIINEFYKGKKAYLAPEKDAYLTTIKTPTTWTIVPAQ